MFFISSLRSRDLSFTTSQRINVNLWPLVGLLLEIAIHNVASILLADRVWGYIF